MATTTISKELREAFEKVLTGGDEAKAREFLVEHLSEFPQDMQDAITMAFVEEALANKAQGDQAISDFKKQGLKTMSALDRAKEEIEKHAKLTEIKKDI